MKKWLEIFYSKSVEHLTICIRIRSYIEIWSRKMLSTIVYEIG